MNKDLTWQERFSAHIKKNKKKSLPHSIIGIILISAFIFGFDYVSQPEDPGNPDDPDASESVQALDSTDAIFTASMVGDMMFARNVQEIVQIKGYDHLFKYVEPYFERSDYVTGNFEQSVVLGEDYETADKEIVFKTTETGPVEALANAHFTNVNLANNHAMDYGREGLLDMLQAFDQHGVGVVGAGENMDAAADRVAYDKFGDITVATLGFTDRYYDGNAVTLHHPGVLTADPNIFIDMIAEAKQQADLVFVHVHWGQEYEGSPHPKQVEYGRAMVDAGADIIIGHHPHVLGPVEVYDDSVIFYSLGNFIFDQGWTRTRETVLPQYHLYEDGTAEVELHPLLIREATPAPPAGPFKLYHRERIFMQLTNESNVTWSRQDDKFSIELDHSFVLDEES